MLAPSLPRGEKEEREYDFNRWEIERMAKKSAKKSAAKKPAAKKSAAKKPAAKKSAKRKPNAAFMKPLTSSPALAAVIGERPMPRTEVTKRLWDYIKKNKLQDAKNRRMIYATASLDSAVASLANCITDR